MNDFLESILGLEKGFLSREGEQVVRFLPKWPTEPLIDLGAANWIVGLGVLLVFSLITWLSLTYWRRGPWWLRSLLAAGLIITFAVYFALLSGAVAWNLSLASVAACVLLYVYYHEGRSTPVRIGLGVLRAVLVAFVLALLNRPVLSVITTRIEPSVVIVMIDDSLSMSIKDVDENPETSRSRMEAVAQLLAGEDQALLKRLGKTHQLHFYRFNRDARPLGPAAAGATGDKPLTEEQVVIDPALVKTFTELKPVGDQTQVTQSILRALSDLQGQRMAGVVLITDGRDAPLQPREDSIKALVGYNVPVYPVAIGSDRAPTNLEIRSTSVQDSAFVDDIVNVRLTIQDTGFPAGHPARIRLKDKDTGLPLKTEDGKPVEKTVSLPDGDQPLEEELQFKPEKVGPLTVVAEIERQPGEFEVEDNVDEAFVAVLDAKIAVLYVDGYPRWEYRYIKNEMIRDKTVNISCLLTSADPGFAQEGDAADSSLNFPGPIKRFPETIDELMSYDVVVFGDVDPKHFTDRQLQLVADFVAKRGGGFGMIAGPLYAPSGYLNSPVESILPVNIRRTLPEYDIGQIPDGWRPVLTKDGEGSSIYRFFADKKENERFLKEDLQPLFWFCKNVTVKPGVGEVYAEHPYETGPDGRKAPILTVGRFGAGRTLFSAVDDSWRWRYYTGEMIFDTYWVQQLRYLARGKKLGQRRLTFVSNAKKYVQGDQVKLTLRVLDPVLQQQLPAEIAAEVLDDKDQVVRREKMQRDAAGETYTASFQAEDVGRYTVRLPAGVAPEAAKMDLPLSVILPQLERSEPQVDRVLLRRLAAETSGQEVPYAEARTKLPQLIVSAARTIPRPNDASLWNAPLAMAIFVLLLTLEWVIRKVKGML